MEHINSCNYDLLTFVIFLFGIANIFWGARIHFFIISLCGISISCYAAFSLAGNYEIIDFGAALSLGVLGGIAAAGVIWYVENFSLTFAGAVVGYVIGSAVNASFVNHSPSFETAVVTTTAGVAA